MSMGGNDRLGNDGFYLRKLQDEELLEETWNRRQFCGGRV